jgi:2-dehydro-3-deoxyphosphogluconate aldolase/(4S)-4-hydroxy-2-oxoglutarate aldolase
MTDMLNHIGQIGIVPVVTISNLGDAEPLVRSLADGGVPVIEVMLRSAKALKAIELIAKSVPDVLLGAGTVLNVEQARAALDAGAQFIVSPGCNKSVVEFCLAKNVVVLPGVVTPTELATALDLGVSTVKFFPAQAAGGVGYLKAISAPFPDAKFVPTGGIDESNMLAYVGLPSVLAVGGSWMVKQELITQHRFDEIIAITERNVRLIMSVKMDHG